MGVGGCAERYGLFTIIVLAIGAGIQAQLHLAHADQGVGPLVPVAAVALPVAVSLAAIAWLQHAANGQASEAVWLYLGAAMALAPLPLSGLLSPASADVFLALVVVAFVARLRRPPRR